MWWIAISPRKARIPKHYPPQIPFANALRGMVSISINVTLLSHSEQAKCTGWFLEVSWVSITTQIPMLNLFFYL